MNYYNPLKHHRQSIRLKGYDYSRKGLYFITLICNNRAHLFGEIVDGEMHLNAYGQIAAEEWLHTEKVRDNVVMHAFVIMPNHMHGIIEIKAKKKSSAKVGEFRSPSQTVGSIVRGYKVATIKRIKALQSEVEGKSARVGGDLGRDSAKGELQFAPTAPKGEPQLSAPSKGELQFAPTPTPTPTPTPSKIWLRNYHDIIILDSQAYKNITNYIINNPKRWGKDKFRKK